MGRCQILCGLRPSSTAFQRLGTEYPHPSVVGRCVDRRLSAGDDLVEAEEGLLLRHLRNRAIEQIRLLQHGRGIAVHVKRHCIHGLAAIRNVVGLRPLGELTQNFRRRRRVVDLGVRIRRPVLRLHGRFPLRFLGHRSAEFLRDKVNTRAIGNGTEPLRAEGYRLDGFPFIVDNQHVDSTVRQLSGRPVLRLRKHDGSARFQTPARQRAKCRRRFALLRRLDDEPVEKHRAVGDVGERDEFRSITALIGSRTVDG